MKIPHDVRLTFRPEIIIVAHVEKKLESYEQGLRGIRLEMMTQDGSESNQYL